MDKQYGKWITVTTKIITFLIGNPYKPSFTTVTVRGPHPRYIQFYMKGPAGHDHLHGSLHWLFSWWAGRVYPPTNTGHHG